MGNLEKAAAGTVLVGAALYFGPKIVHEFGDLGHLPSIAPRTETFKPHPSWIANLTFPGVVIVSQADSGKEYDVSAGGGLFGDAESFVFGRDDLSTNINVPEQGKVQVLESLDTSKPTISKPPTWQLSWEPHKIHTFDSAGKPINVTEWGVKAKINVDDSKYVVQLADPDCQRYSTMINHQPDPKAGECKGSATSSAIANATPYITVALILATPELKAVSFLTKLVFAGAVGELEKIAIGGGPDKTKTTLAAARADSSAMIHECGSDIATQSAIRRGDTKVLQAVLRMNAGLVESDGAPNAQQRAQMYLRAANNTSLLDVELVHSNGAAYKAESVPLKYAEPVVTNSDLSKAVGGGVDVKTPSGGSYCIPSKNFGFTPTAAKKPQV